MEAHAPTAAPHPVVGLDELGEVVPGVRGQQLGRVVVRHLESSSQRGCQPIRTIRVRNAAAPSALGARLRPCRFPTPRSSSWSVRPGPGSRPGQRRAIATSEVVSSDALRAVVGSGTADLDASDDAFRILDQIVEGRVARGLTVVIDTLGLDPVRRAVWAALARAGGLVTVAVVLDTPAAVCRARNADRDRPVPATRAHHPAAADARRPRRARRRRLGRPGRVERRAGAGHGGTDTRTSPHARPVRA